MHVTGRCTPGLPKVGRTPIGGQRRVRQRRSGVRIRYKIDEGRGDVNSPQEFRHPDGQQPQADDRIDMEKGPIHPA